MRRIIPSAAARSRSVMVAVVLGTALSAATGHAAIPTRSAAAEADPVRDITRYCQVCWRNARLPVDRWDDCTQQVFARLLERVDVAKWHTLLKDDAEDRREFIRAIDAVKKRTQRAGSAPTCPPTSATTASGPAPTCGSSARRFTRRPTWYSARGSGRSWSCRPTAGRCRTSRPS